MKISGQSWLGLGLLAGALGSAGCALETGGPSACEGADCSAASTVAQPLVGGWATKHTWASNGTDLSSTKLPLFADDVCVLTRVSGKFAGDGEAVELTDDGTNWRLQGFSHQQGASAEAYCFRRSDFIGGGARVSSEYSLSAMAHRSCDSVVQTSLYAADAFSYLTGFQGRMQGSGEWFQIDQATSPDLTSTFQAHTCGSSSDVGITVLLGFARSYRVGAHTARLANFSNRDGMLADINNRPEYVAGGNVASDVAVLAPVDNAMCGLTSIQGDFEGNGESVQIRDEEKNGLHWVLRTTKGAGSNFVKAGARCYSRTQGS